MLVAAGLAIAAAGRWSELVQFAREYVKPTDAVAAVLLIAAAWTTKCALSLAHDVISSATDRCLSLDVSVAFPRPCFPLSRSDTYPMGLQGRKLPFAEGFVLFRSKLLSWRATNHYDVRGDGVGHALAMQLAVLMQLPRPLTEGL